MVFLQKLTTSQINSLPPEGGLLIYDSDLNVCKFKDGTGTAQFLNTDGNGSLNLSDSGATALLTLNSTSSAEGSMISMTTNGNDWRIIAGGSTNSTLSNSFFIYDSTSSLSRLSIDTSGNVNIINHNNTSTGLKLGGTLVTASASELNILDGVTATATELNYLDLTTGPGTAQASKALVLDSSSNIAGINSLSATSLTGTIATNAQPNITSLGTLTTLACTGTSTFGVVDTSILRVVSSGSTFYLQPGISNTSGSACDFFIGNAFQTTITSARKFIIKADGKIGIGTYAPDKQLEINNATGDCLRLTHNDSDGIATNYADFNVSSGGDLTIRASGTDLTFSQTRCQIVIGSSFAFQVTDGTNIALRVDTTNSSVEINQHDGISKGLKLGATLVTATAAELNILDGVTATGTEINYLDLTTGPGTAQASKALVLDSSSNITGINSLSATSLTGTIATNAQPNITSVGTLIGLTTSGNVIIDNTSTEALLIRKVGDTGDIFTVDTTNSITRFTGSLNINSETMYPMIVKDVNLTTGTYSNTNFYPVALRHNIAGTYGEIPIITFQICGVSLSASDSYNENTVYGIARGGGFSDHKDYYDVAIQKHTESEHRMLGIFRGTTSFLDGIVIYLRGGYTYSIITDADMFNIGTDTAALTIGASIFAIKNSSRIDVTGISTNIIELIALDTSSGKYVKGNISSTNYTGTISTAAQPNITSLGTLTALNTSGSNVGINTSSADRSLEVNSAIGNCMRLTYNDSNGSAVNYVDLLVSSSGDMTISATGGDVNISTHNGSTLGLQLGGTLVTATAAELNILDGVTATAAEINYLDLTTGPGTAQLSKALVLDSSSNITGINSLSATSLTGTIATNAQPNITSLGTLTALNTSGSNVGINTSSADRALEVNSAVGNCMRLTYNDSNGTAINYVDLLVTASGDMTLVPSGGDVNISTHNGSTLGLQLAGNLVTATAAEINYLDLASGTGVGQANKALVLNSSSNITAGVNNLTATSFTGTIVTNSQPNITSLGTLTGLNTSGSNVGINTSSADRALEVNSANGQCLRLTYNDSNGTAINYVDLLVSANGDLTLTPSGGDINISTHNGATTGLQLGGTLVTASANEINILDGVTATTTEINYLDLTTGPGTAQANKVLVLNSSSNITTGINSLAAISLSATNITGTLQTNAQTNITSVGTLIGLNTSGANVGINTSAADRALEINSATGNCLRLTYNDINGLATNYVDLLVSSSGDMTLTPSGGDINISTHNGSTLGLQLGGTLVTATAAELNILDGVTATAAELNILDGVTATAAEINYLDLTTGPGTAQASKAMVLDSSSNIIGINSLTATTINTTNLSFSGDLIVDNTSIEALLVRKDGDTGDIFTVDTTNSITRFTGSLSVNTETMYPTIVKDVNLTTGTYSNSNFYPVALRRSIAGSHGSFPFITFQVCGLSLSGTDSYNENTLYGIVRGGGFSDHRDYYDVAIQKFSDTEHRLLGIFKGANSFQDGIVIYLRGGYTYSINTDANTFNIGTDTAALTISSSTFAIKNSSRTDVTGTSVDITEIIALDTTSGKYVKGSISSTNYIGTISTAAQPNITSLGTLTGLNTSGSNVGINTSSAGRALEINSTNGQCLRLTYNDSNGSATIYTDLNVSSGGDFIISTTSGKTGINKATPTSTFHIKQIADTNSETNGMIIEKNGSGDRWGLNVNTSNNFQFRYNGTATGWIDTAGGDNVFNFTGQHRCKSIEDINNININEFIGLIVSTTGLYKNINNEQININDALPIVTLSTIPNDKKVFGTISSREDENSDRSYAAGVFNTYKEKIEGDERLFINSVGEGMVWVCNNNGNFENGDFITTSNLPGYGQLQNDDLFHNYTFGKITQSCDFSTPERYIDLLGNIVDKPTYDSDPSNYRKCNFVGCVYYCG